MLEYAFFDREYRTYINLEFREGCEGRPSIITLEVTSYHYEFLLSSIDDVGGCRVRIRVYKSGASFSRLIRKYILAHY